MNIINSVNSSVEDLTSTLRLINPVTGFEIKDTLERLNNSLVYEIKNKNRVSVARLLKAKINRVKKLKPGASNE